jgi:RNA polymerase sigma-70 factor, ECF subfamily
MLNDLDESEDVVQNIIMKLWENRENIETIVNIKSYLFKSTYNSCLNIISKHGKKLNYEKESWLKLKEIEMEERDSLLYNELNEIVNRLIDELPDQCQRVFKMNRLDEKSYKEIAQELNITVKAVEGNISRALQKMRLGLKDYLYLILILYF